MKKSQLVQIIKEALTDKVKAVTVSVDKLQKGDTMAADKAKVTSIKKDGDNFEITTERQMSNGKYIKHFELASEMTGRSHLDSRVTMFTEDAIREYVRFVEGDE